MKNNNRFIFLLIFTIGIISILTTGLNAAKPYRDPKINIKPSNKYTEIITISADKKYPPFSYLDKDGNPQGFDIELIYMLAEEMKVNIELNLVSWPEALKTMKFEEADIILGLEYSEKYLEKFHLSKPVQINEFVAFGTKSFDRISQLYTKKIGVLENSISDTLFIKPHNLQPITTYHTSYEGAFQSILNGEIDYLIGRYAVGKRVLDQEGITKIRPVGEILNSNAFCFGVQKDNLELQKKLDQAIDNLNRSGELSDLNNKWLGHFVDITTIEDFFGVYKNQLTLIIGIVFSIILYYLSKRKALKNQIKYEKEVQEKLKHMVETDELTGLISRYKFLNDASEKLRSAKPNEYLIATIDIDNFKYLNESFGFQRGNEVLKMLAQHFRESFTNDALITRENSDNFIIFSKNTYNGRTFCGKDYCIGCISKLFRKVLNKNFKMNISKGIYIVSNPKKDIGYMIDCANVARSEGKNIYGSTAILFTNAMREKEINRNIIISNMENGITNEEFYVVYQPKYSLTDKKCVGAEALVRWRTGSGMMFYPDDFIPLFEKNSFIIKLDYYVLESVCKLISNSNYELPQISVNLSGRTLLDKALVENYVRITNKYKVNPSQLEIEITESAIIESYDIVKNRVAQLKKAGFTISLDDFGTCISLLNRLQDLNVDIIKLDREFINSSLSRDKGISIIKNILTMSKELNLITVAEGIETQKQLNILKGLKCDIGQGYYFTEPMSEDDFFEKLASENK